MFPVIEYSCHWLRVLQSTLTHAIIIIVNRPLKADSHIACRSHAVPLACRAAKGLECAFPIWFTQCGLVWFTLAIPCPCHAPTIRLKATAQHGRRKSAVLCCVIEKNGMVGAKHGHGMASVNQTRPHCVNQMGKAHFKPLAARHGRGTAWARHGNGMLCVNRPLVNIETETWTAVARRYAI